MDLKVKIKENLLEGEKICIKICYNNMVRIFVKKKQEDTRWGWYKIIYNLFINVNKKGISL